MHIVIIGGSGGMGQCFLKFFKKNNISAIAVGRSTENYQEEVEKADIIIISVPIHAVKATIERISKYNISEKILLNFASQMKEGFEELKNLPCQSFCVHPLFGPDLTDFSDQNIIVAPEKVPKKLEALLSKLHARITYTTPEYHDTIIKNIQALPQFSAIILAKTIADTNIPFEQLEKFSTLSFRIQTSMIQRIMQQSPELWANIQFYQKSPNTTLIENGKELQEIILKKDQEKFNHFFNKAYTYWKHTSKNAYQETKKTLSAIDKESLAVLGPEGTFSQKAAKVHTTEKKLVFTETIDEVINLVALEKVEEGIVPFENSIHGTVIQTIDGIYKNKIYVTKEIIIPIVHCAAALQNIPPGDVTQIFGHPQALEQCKQYLTKYPFAKKITTPSTAAGFQKIQEESLTHAIAIGPEIGAETYGLTILDTNIQDVLSNETAFFVINKHKKISINATKTLLVIYPKQDKPGLLSDILETFKKENVNLSKLESRPSREKLGIYVFYITLDTANQEIIEKIIKNLNALHIDVANLGSYEVQNESR